MTDLKDGNLTIAVEQGEDVRLIWYGRSESRDPSEILNPYLASIQDALSDKSIVLDFITLEYMNSSTIPPILHTLKKLNNGKVSTLVLYNELSNWQSISFCALRDAVKEMEYIKVEGRRPVR